MNPNQKISTFLISIALFITGSGFSSENPNLPGDPHYNELVKLYQSFRTFHLPEVTNGVPDYTPSGMYKKFQGLQEYQKNLSQIDTTGWSRSSQVDFRIVEAEMRGMEFEHRIQKPWEKDPAFYAVIRFQFGPKMHPSMGVPSLPIPDRNIENIRTQLKAIPQIIEQAKQNLTDPIADLAHIAIYTTNEQMGRMRPFIEQLPNHHPDLLNDAKNAYNAINSYREWLIANKPNMRNGAGFGVENYNWYLKNVALLPYTWEDLLLLSEREYERAIATMKIKEHRNRHIPQLNPVDNREEYISRHGNAMDHKYRFMLSSELFTVPDYLNPPSHARGWSRGNVRDYFEHVLDRYPLPLTLHGYAGHDHDALRTARDNRPIRGQNRLYFIDGVRAEALATGVERWYYHLGIVDNVPRADELTYNLKALRAARSITDLKMHSNEMTFEEAFQFNIDHTPYGWVPEGSRTLWHDLELYLRLPLYGTSYLVGPLLVEKLMTKAFLQMGDDFNITNFMDQFLESGMIPISLTTYELLGE